MVFLAECTLKPLLHDIKDTNDDHIDDDALSLCDLPIYSNSGSNSFSSYDRCEYQEEANTGFEFFSGELSTGHQTVFQENEDIVFCGKLIVRKDENFTTKPKKQNVLFSWKRLKIVSFRKSASKKKAIDKRNTESDTRERASLSGRKVSTLVTSPTKSRWYLFMFGQARFPQALTMDLSDLKERQRRQCSPSTSMNLRAQESRGSSISRGRGIWSLLKESATSMGKTSNGNEIVRAVGCISLV